MTTELWRFRDDEIANATVVGLEVEASDGGIGRVDAVTAGDDASWIVVDTGPWVFGRLIVLPAGLVERVDAAAARVVLALAKEDVRHAPDFDPREGLDDDARREVGEYFRSRAAGGAS